MAGLESYVTSPQPQRQSSSEHQGQTHKGTPTCTVPRLQRCRKTWQRQYSGYLGRRPHTYRPPQRLKKCSNSA